MIKIKRVDYHNSSQTATLVHLLNLYAQDPMGGGKPLDDEVKQQLITRLQKISGAMSLLAYKNEKAVGLLNAFTGFSTFAAKPLVNVHDIMVVDDCRGQGVAQQLLDNCAVIAKKQGCCKLTLEVLGNNDVAKASYRKFGFNNYILNEEYGAAEFWEKKL